MGRISSTDVQVFDIFFFLMILSGASVYLRNGKLKVLSISDLTLRLQSVLLIRQLQHHSLLMCYKHELPAHEVRINPKTSKASINIVRYFQVDK